MTYFYALWFKVKSWAAGVFGVAQIESRTEKPTNKVAKNPKSNPVVAPPAAVPSASPTDNVITVMGWTERGYQDYIQGPEGTNEKIKFYTGIVGDGTNFPVVFFNNDDYRYWNSRAREYATAWLAEFATPAPRKHNGMGQ